MPNHLHGLIELLPVQPGQDTSPISAIVRTFKSRVTRCVNRLGDLTIGSVWHRGYWDRIVRDEDELNAIRRYIQENPIRWAEERDNLDPLLDRMSPR